VINEGKISEQGAFHDLRSQDGFIGKVLLHPELLDSIELKEDSATIPSRIKKPLPKGLLGPSANDIADLTRRTGDLSVYKYYLASIGWFWSLASAATAIFYTLGTNLPSK
jgi:ATP-binding cassette subfamily C (CFTR/MRP) protein 1